MGHVTVSTDAHAPADGAGGWAFVVTGGGQTVCHSGPLHPGPSHVGEWVAMAEALRWAETALQAGDELDVQTDSALVAKGLAGRRPAMSGEAAALRAECRVALARLSAAGVRVRVRRVPRGDNAEADAQARRAAAPGPRRKVE